MIDPTSSPSPVNSKPVTYRSTPSLYAASVVVRTSSMVPSGPTRPPHAPAGGAPTSSTTGTARVATAAVSTRFGAR
jgi:hypothetical protein